MNIGFLFLLAISQSIVIMASILPMERDRFRYSELKPTVKFAKEHWSDPQLHEPWKGYEDLQIDKKGQLRAVRRQILSVSKFFMRRGETPTSIVPRLESMLIHENPQEA